MVDLEDDQTIRVALKLFETKAQAAEALKVASYHCCCLHTTAGVCILMLAYSYHCCRTHATPVGAHHYCRAHTTAGMLVPLLSCAPHYWRALPLLLLC